MGTSLYRTVSPHTKAMHKERRCKQPGSHLQGDKGSMVSLTLFTWVRFPLPSSLGLLDTETIPSQLPVGRVKLLPTSAVL